MNQCINCAWVRHRSFLESAHEHAHCGAPHHLTGFERQTVCSAERASAEFESCGKEGRFWKEAPSKPESPTQKTQPSWWDRFLKNGQGTNP